MRERRIHTENFSITYLSRDILSSKYSLPPLSLSLCIYIYNKTNGKKTKNCTKDNEKINVRIIVLLFWQFSWWWFLTGVWVTGSLLKSSELFSVLWPILIMQNLDDLYDLPMISKSPNPFILWGLFQVNQLQLV